MLHAQRLARSAVPAGAERPATQVRAGMAGIDNPPIVAAKRITPIYTAEERLNLQR
jgi:hypothetical protein